MGYYKDYISVPITLNEDNWDILEKYYAISVIMKMDETKSWDEWFEEFENGLQSDK